MRMTEKAEDREAHEGRQPQIMTLNRPNFFILTGCSGGGKSTLLDALKARGIACVDEAGRSIVRQQLALGGQEIINGGSSKWTELILSHNMHNFEGVTETQKPVFFDRGIAECLGHSFAQGLPAPAHFTRAATLYRYNPTVFMLPPWPEIYVQDAERLHGFDDALREYNALCQVYPQCGYTLVEVPKVSVDERAAFVLERTGQVA